MDLPLTDACKRVLAFAAREAETLHHENIGAEHLFLGILREQGCFAEQILRGFGISAEQVRAYFAETGVPAEPPSSRPFEQIAETARQRIAELQPPLHLHLIAEDGSTVADIRWNRRQGRVPQIGEALQLSSAGRKAKYRVVDVLWEIGEDGEAADIRPITLRVREENAPETGN
ncbi:MAG TPA: Clp protease N-terminal domain-containing protein [Acidobacteriaceae bacterium]|nr:Clp protease N-terminal domain-containing protein [Acidobacteriaceae bacterium]